jgi:hypothetical protein
MQCVTNFADFRSRGRRPRKADSAGNFDSPSRHSTLVLCFECFSHFKFSVVRRDSFQGVTLEAPVAFDSVCDPFASGKYIKALHNPNSTRQILPTPQRNTSIALLRDISKRWRAMRAIPVCDIPGYSAIKIRSISVSSDKFESKPIAVLKISSTISSLRSSCANRSVSSLVSILCLRFQADAVKHASGIVGSICR